MHRRDFLKSMALGGASAALLPSFAFDTITSHAFGAEVPATGIRPLSIVSRTIEINGRAVSVFGLVDAEGRSGLTFTEGDRFNVALRNGLKEPTLVHWHGLLPPYEQDGVPDMPMPLLKPGELRNYDFPVGRAGTFWMHAHTLQEQKLLAAPLIVRDREAASRDEQEVVILLHDFSFKSPEELLAGLQKSSGHGGGMGDGHMMDGQMMHGPMGAMHANDIEYDAYLSNDRTLNDPEVVTVEKSGRVRLRIINGATATVFTIDTGAVDGELIAVDGQDIEPLRGRRFPIAMGQRLDIRLTLPKDSKAFPILALREDAPERTGFILAPAGTKVEKLSPKGDAKGPLMALDLEQRLRAKIPLANRPADRSIPVMLMGGNAGYRWEMTAPSYTVRKGEHVHIVMQNHTTMAHPMHLHGHHFQVVAIDGTPLAGAVRDTVQIPPKAEVTVAFNADHPGKWAFHCHHLYHMAAGMMVTLGYEGVS